MLVYGLLLMLQVPAQDRSQHWVSYVMRGVSLARQVPSLYLVLPLGTSFHPFQSPGYRLFLGLYIGAFEK